MTRSPDSGAGTGETSGEPLEICLVGPGLKFLGGLSVYTNQLARALGERHFVSVLLLRNLLPARLYPGGHRVGRPLSSLSYEGQRSFDGIDWFWGRSLMSGLRFLRVRPPDVLVLQWWTAAAAHTYLVLALFARARRIPIVIEFHEVQDTGEAQVPGLATYSKWALRALTRLARGGIVHHEHDLADLEQTVRVRDLALEIAPHAAYDHLHDVVPVVPEELQAVLPGDDVPSAVANSERFLLFFGLIRPYKGLDDFVAAIDLLDDDVVAHARFLIVGETWENAVEGLQAAARSRHRDRITVVNRYVTDAEAAAVFAVADALVLPYKRASSSGPMAIAMSHGIEVIHYDLPALTANSQGYERVQRAPVGDVAALAAALERTITGGGDAVEVLGFASTWKDTTDSFDRLFAQVLAS